MKKIAFISYRFPPQNPGGVIRGVKFIKYLSKAGFRVDVFVPQGSSTLGFEKDLSSERIFFHYIPCPKPFDWIRSKKLGILNSLKKQTPTQNQQTNEAKLAQTPKMSFFLRVLWLLRFPDDAIFWKRNLSRALKEYWKHHPDSQVAFVHGPPFSPMITLQSLAKRYRKKVICDFRDPWSPEIKTFPFSWCKTWVQKKEREILLDSAAITTVTQTLQMELQDIEKQAAPAHLILNGYDEDDFSNLDLHAHPKKFLIAHGGNTHQRDIEPFLKGLEIFLKQHPRANQDTELWFCGTVDSETERKIFEAGLNIQCQVEDNKPHQVWLHEIPRVAVWVLLQHPSNAYENAIPGKLFEYIASRRPILSFGPKGEVQKIFDTHEWGQHFTDKDSAEKVATQLGRYYELWQKKQISTHIDTASIEKYTRAHGARKLIQVIESL